MEKKRNSFGGSLGFIMAAAGSAVGLGNIWRFPYLAAKNGGGLFLVTYLILALTFGFTLLSTEIAIGRKTKQSALTAYGELKKSWKPLGLVASLIPAMILPYYCVIGGWVIKYFVAYCSAPVTKISEDGYFTGFITAQFSPIIFLAIFMAIVAFIVARGVNKGIESFSKFVMPALVVLVIIIAIYCITLKFTSEDGTTRTGLQGLMIYLIPNVSGMGAKDILTVIFDAMGQLFYSLSVSMGIMVTYGSYVNDKTNLVSSINQIEIFDTIIAFLAGVMIIPAVFTFMGTEGMSASGPGLMFVCLPKVFTQMGIVGKFIGILFFAMVIFAAITSAVSILETVVASLIDQFSMSRAVAVLLTVAGAFIMGTIVCLGYNIFYFEFTLPNGAVAQILDIMDYISNNLLMPIVAIGTCILIGWIVKPKVVIDEIEKTGHNFARKYLYIGMVKVVAPILLVILFLISIGVI